MEIKPFEISRAFDAPRDRVWKAWTDAGQLRQWWGPKGFKVTHCTLDLRPGGLMHYGLRAPDGSEIWGKFVFREITPPERLVWVNSFSDKDGGTTVHPMMPAWPRELLTTVEFRVQGGGTLVTVRWIPVDGATDLERRTFDAGRASMNMGWSGTLDQLTAHMGKP